MVQKGKGQHWKWHSETEACLLGDLKSYQEIRRWGKIGNQWTKWRKWLDSYYGSALGWHSQATMQQSRLLLSLWRVKLLSNFSFSPIISYLKSHPENSRKLIIFLCDSSTEDPIRPQTTKLLFLWALTFPSHGKGKKQILASGDWSGSCNYASVLRKAWNSS